MNGFAPLGTPSGGRYEWPTRIDRQDPRQPQGCRAGGRRHLVPASADFESGGAWVISGHRAG
jgi:hypothetical protein